MSPETLAADDGRGTNRGTNRGRAGAGIVIVVVEVVTGTTSFRGSVGPINWSLPQRLLPASVDSHQHPLGKVAWQAPANIQTTILTIL
jgi:hypothetical protein